MAGNHKRRSKGGRPKKAGARYPSGKLKPQRVEPNARVLADRERLMGSLNNLHLADHPLDLALARGWLTEAQHRAGMSFARLHRQAQLGAPGLDQGRCQAIGEPVDVAAKGLQDWTDEETSAVFDAVFNREPPSGRDEAATASLRAIRAALKPEEYAEVVKVAVYASWPQWIIQRAAGHFHTPWERGRERLITGLDLVARTLRPRRPPADRPAAPVGEGPAPEPRHGPIREEVTDYVTADGEPLYTAVRRSRAIGPR